MQSESPQADFFINYHKSDLHWAEWIAWELEDAGYQTVIEAWDFSPRSNSIQKMQEAATNSKGVILVLSQSYLDVSYTIPELTTAFAFFNDPTISSRVILPIRVEPVELDGLLSALAYIDLVGKNDESARIALLQGLSSGRNKPIEPPRYPGDIKRAVPIKPITFPGSALPDPPELYPYLEHFKYDNAKDGKTAFIMMKFGQSKRHKEILNACIQTLNNCNIKGLRADGKTYADYLMANIRTYMHGCDFGVAIFERIESDIHNPNVALEVGYMMALGKPVCLLKDRTLAKLPTDIIGYLYKEFDVDNLDSTIDESLMSWLQDKGIV